jgi:hypothetical protein
MREYVKYSLYDRISTRPFLTDIEKRWIAFQVLYALHQCHKVGVSDILLVYLYSIVISHLYLICFDVVLTLLHDLLTLSVILITVSALSVSYRILIYFYLSQTSDG